MVCRAEVTFMAEIWNVESGENRRPIDFIIVTRAVRVRCPRFDVGAERLRARAIIEAMRNPKDDHSVQLAAR
jgi:hypothetical protein